MGPTWGPPGSCRPQMGPMLAPWTLLSGTTPHPIYTQWGTPLVMMTSSNGNIFRDTGHLCGEFTGPGEFPAQRSVTRSFDVFFDLSLNKRLSKQSRGWWFETQSHPLWRHCNVWHANSVLSTESLGKSLLWCIETLSYFFLLVFFICSLNPLLGLRR